MHAVVRSVWDEPRAPRPPTRTWWDWSLVGVLVAVALLEGVLRSDLSSPAGSVAIVVGLAPVLLWRRSRPLLAATIAFGVAAAVAAVTAGEVPELNAMVFMLLLPYSLVRWGSGREIVTGFAVVFASVCVCLFAAAPTSGDVVGGFAVLAASLALGGAFRFRSGARLREFDQVKSLERERLARDLHDTVAHHVSAIAIRAQAGLVLSASHPDAATEALRVIEIEASRTLAEMRSMVRVLRHDERPDQRRDGRHDEQTALMPSPSVADLEQLASRARAGPAVDVEIVGEVGDLPPSVGAAIFRLAQESVTNALRHARNPNRIEVRVVADDTAVRVRVSDDGDVGAGRQPVSPGYGLTGMIERAHLLGGTCEAGPNPDRGWTVTAVLPRAGWAT